LNGSVSIPWREGFPDIRDDEGPAVVLRAMRRWEGMTQKVLSQKADIPQGHISAMERGKMPIGVIQAEKLGKELNSLLPQWLLGTWQAQHTKLTTLATLRIIIIGHFKIIIGTEKLLLLPRSSILNSGILRNSAVIARRIRQRWKFGAKSNDGGGRYSSSNLKKENKR
jgi:transcriptional regulator with XRE-family HTH domain